MTIGFKPIRFGEHHSEDHGITGITQGQIKAKQSVVHKIDAMTLFQQDAMQ
ncbi:MAG: hypothetical protein NVSMB33_11180 [Ktedonobacteraceae bacterium]